MAIDIFGSDDPEKDKEFAEHVISLRQNGVTIYSESLPTRCEVCHQENCFNPVTNSCTRCDEVQKIHGGAIPSANEKIASPTFSMEESLRHVAKARADANADEYMKLFFSLMKKHKKMSSLAVAGIPNEHLVNATRDLQVEVGAHICSTSEHYKGSLAWSLIGYVILAGFVVTNCDVPVAFSVLFITGMVALFAFLFNIPDLDNERRFLEIWSDYNKYDSSYFPVQEFRKYYATHYGENKK
jgi:hypothetical protein